MPVRESKHRVDMDREIWEAAAAEAKNLRVSTAWLVSQLVAEGLSGGDGVAVRLVAENRRKIAAAEALARAEGPSHAKQGAQSRSERRSEARR